MAGVVSFNDHEAPWGVKNKYYQILLERLHEQVAPEDKETVFKSLIFQGISFDLLDPVRARRIAHGLRVVSEEYRRELASGTGEQPPTAEMKAGLEARLIDLEQRLDGFLGTT